MIGSLVVSGAKLFAIAVFDTQLLRQYGVRAAKDFLDLEAFHRLRSHLEDRVTSEERQIAKQLAEDLLK